MLETRSATPTAVLVGVQLPGVSDVDHAADLAELGRLVHTLGFKVVATVSQKRDGLASGTLLGDGKLKELAQLTGGTGVVPTGAPERKSKARDKWEEEPEEDEAEPEERPSAAASVVVVDHELSPSQARNLERATGAQVLDRTGVIVEIFHRHAKSREARCRSRSRGSTTWRRGCGRPAGGDRSGSRAAAPASRALEARPAQDPRPHRRAARSSWRPSSATATSAATPGRTSCAWRWSATPTPASRR